MNMIVYNIIIDIKLYQKSEVNIDIKSYLL